MAAVPLAADRPRDLEAAARALGSERVELVPAAEAERATGDVVGRISPFGQGRRLPLPCDRAALDEPAVFVDGGRRGRQLELAPADLLAAGRGLDRRARPPRRRLRPPSGSDSVPADQGSGRAAVGAVRNGRLAMLGRRLVLGAAAAGVLLLGGPAKAAIELKINGLHAPDHALSMTHEFFAERVEQLTNGEIKLDVHHARGLGDAVESVQSIRNGTIAFFTVSAANLSQVDPRIDMFSLPFLFKNAKHYWWYLTSERARNFVKPLEEKGIVVLAFMDSGARSFFAKDEITDPSKLVGKKIRTMASPVQIAMMEAFGGTGVPIAWGELYNALQTGVVDGAENNPPSIRSMKFYEVTKVLVLNEHARIPDILIASKRVMDRLTPKQREAIFQAAREAEAFMRGAWAADEKASLAFLKSLPNFKVIENVDKKPFLEKVSALLDREAKRLGVEDEVKYLLDTQKNF